MSEAVTKRYARALFEVAEEHGKIDQVEEDLNAVVQAFKDEKAEKVFLNPRLDAEEKKKLIETFAQAVTSEVANFLKVLVDHHRGNQLAEIAREYTKAANEARGIVSATVTTAVPLSDEERKQLAEQFGKAIDKKIQLEEKVDREIIGGVLIRVGNRVYDGTVAG
ncbi:MAG TPA: F0F1 ATP synthase subunit delta, partial [Bacillales bacterium]|nr:F0F1 ATP synthase subunit delta [Bacillales bacterium]